MVGMAIGLAAGGAAVGLGVGIAQAAGAPIPAMIRCLDPTALGLVLFSFNPSEITMTRTANLQSQGNATGGTSRNNTASVPTTQINITKATFTGDQTKLMIDQLLAWTAPPQGLFTAIAGLFNVTSSSQPTCTFQWGPPMVGFMYDVLIKQVTAKYNRFHSSGIPVRAIVDLQLVVQPSLLGSLPTNPTSGGLPGRTTHLVRDGDSLQSIAQRHYGRPGVWRKIAEINGITDPRRVRPGMTVYLPGPAELTAGSR